MICLHRFFEDLINERLSQKIQVSCPLVLTVQSLLAAVYRIDLFGTPCKSYQIRRHRLLGNIILSKDAKVFWSIKETKCRILTLKSYFSGFLLRQQRQFANRQRGPRGRCCFGPLDLRRRFANQRRSSQLKGALVLIRYSTALLRSLTQVVFCVLHRKITTIINSDVYQIVNSLLYCKSENASGKMDIYLIQFHYNWKQQ